MTLRTNPPSVGNEGERAAHMWIWLLWWIPLSVVIGFAAASWFLSPSWPLWQVVPLAFILATPFAIGAYYGFRAIRLGESQGWIGFILHVMLVVTALAMPISEALA
jgi:hypothetical protein